MIPVGFAFAAAGAGCAAWASTVENGPPGWRTGLSMVLLVAGCALVLTGAMS